MFFRDDEQAKLLCNLANVETSGEQKPWNFDVLDLAKAFEVIHQTLYGWIRQL